MKQLTEEAIDNILSMQEECDEQLFERINKLLVYIENIKKFNKDNLHEAKLYANEIKDWMNSYHLFINNFVDSLINTL